MGADVLAQIKLIRSLGSSKEALGHSLMLILHMKIYAGYKIRNV